MIRRLANIRVHLTEELDRLVIIEIGLIEDSFPEVMVQRHASGDDVLAVHGAVRGVGRYLAPDRGDRNARQDRHTSPRRIVSRWHCVGLERFACHAGMHDVKRLPRCLGRAGCSCKERRRIVCITSGRQWRWSYRGRFVGLQFLAHCIKLLLHVRQR